MCYADFLGAMSIVWQQFLTIENEEEHYKTLH